MKWQNIENKFHILQSEAGILYIYYSSLNTGIKYGSLKESNSLRAEMGSWSYLVKLQINPKVKNSVYTISDFKTYRTNQSKTNVHVGTEETEDNDNTGKGSWGTKTQE